MATEARQVVVMPTKSTGIAVILAILFGPLGMLYATIGGGIIMFFVNLLALFLTAGVGLILTWPIGVIWAAMAVNSYNSRLLASTSR